MRWSRGRNPVSMVVRRRYVWSRRRSTGGLSAGHDYVGAEPGRRRSPVRRHGRGSTDGSVEIIREHADRLHSWRSHPDAGQYAAVEEGFSRGDGEILGWINADDILCPWALKTVQEVFRDCPQVEWLTTRFPLVIAMNGTGLRCVPKGGFTRDAFLRGDYLPGANQASNGFVQQESTFWRRGL